VLRDGFHGPPIFDFTNIARVEVVKGPASFLYGQLAPGGVVNVITKSPGTRLAAAAAITYGSFEQYRLEADVTGPALSTLSYRLAASYEQDSHYWKPYDAHSWGLAPSLRWQPSERLSVTLKYERFSKSETPQLMQKPGYSAQSGPTPTPSDPNLSGVDVPGLPDSWNSMSFADFRHSNTSSLSAWIDFKADEHWSLRAGYSHLDDKIDALFSGNFGMANNTTLLQGRRLRRQIYTNRGDTFEAQAVGRYQIEHTSVRVLLGGQHLDRGFTAWAAQAPTIPPSASCRSARRCRAGI
jgi:iron complex outermembrane receptor protein